MNIGSYYGLSTAIDPFFIREGEKTENVHLSFLTQVTGSGERIGSSQVLFIFPGLQEAEVICLKNYDNFDTLQA
jgi:hypothetical protein